MIVSLIGYRATGKTTVGMLLAERLGWSCVDTDQRIQQLAGKSVRQIFEVDGEASFRDWETRVIEDLTRRHKLVLALGGGAILREQNRRAIQVAGPVVWLSASAEEIRARLAADPETFRQRPSLTGAAPWDEVDAVLAVRLPLYEATADFVVHTEGRPPRQIVEEILGHLRLPDGTPSRLEHDD